MKIRARQANETQQTEAQQHDMTAIKSEMKKNFMEALETASENSDGALSKKEILAAVQSTGNDNIAPGKRFRRAFRRKLAQHESGSDGRINLEGATQALNETMDAPVGERLAETANDRAALTVFQRQVKTQLSRMHGRDRSEFTERESFGALAAAMVKRDGGFEAIEVFYDRFEDALNSPRGQTDKGVVYATNRAIKRARTSGFITRQQAHEIRSQAHGAAQQDDNPYSLGNPTLESAIQYQQASVLSVADEKFTAYTNGDEKALNRPERKEAKRQERLDQASAADALLNEETSNEDTSTV